MNRSRLALAALLVCLPVGPAAAADFDRYLPDRTEAVISVQVKELFEAPVFKDQRDELKQLARSLNLAPKALDLLGIDPFAHVTRVALAVPANVEQDRLTVFVRGSFDNAKLQAAAEKAAKEELVKMHAIASHTVYEIPLPGQVEPIFVALLEQGMLVASADRDMVLEALDKKTGRRKSEVRKELVQLLGRSDSKHLIAIAALPRALTAFGLLNNTANLVQNLTGGIAVGDDIQMEFIFATREVQAARTVAGQLEDAVNQSKALVALFVTKEKRFSPLAELLDAVTIAAKGSETTLRLTLGKELVEKSLKKSE